MISRAPLIWLVFAALFLSGCDSAENLVNRRLPPVPEDQLRDQAIQNARAAIAGLNDANAGFNLRIEDIAAAIKASGVTQRLDLGSVTLRGDRQLIVAEVDVAKIFSKGDFPGFDASLRDRIERLRPEIKGKITLGLSLSSTNTLADDGRLTIAVRLLPVFRNVEVNHVLLAGPLDVDLVVTLMNGLADRLSGELGRAEIATVSLPLVPFKEAELAREAGPGSAVGSDEMVKFTAKPAPSSVYLRSVAWLVDDGHATFLADLAPIGAPPVVDSADPGKDDFAQLKSEFAEKLSQGLDMAKPASANWVAVSKKLVADLINSGLQRGQPCLRFEATLPDQIFSKPISIPDDLPMDCTPEIDCRPTKDCRTVNNCEQAEDCRSTHDCRVCALGACFDDPACAREKLVASQNCEVRKATRVIACELRDTEQKTDCERERAVERATCQSGKAGKELACEAGKQAIENLAKAENLAKLSATLRGSANMSICMKEMSVAPSLEKLAASAIVRGEGSVGFDLKYVPQDIAGYLDCRFPWAESKPMKIELPEELAKFDGVVVLDTSKQNPTLRASFKASALNASIRPNPREFLLASYGMRATCAPVGAMLHEVTLDVTPSVPDIGSDISLAGQDRTLVLTLEPMTLRFAGANVVGKDAYESNAKALVLSVDPSSVPAN